MGPGYPFRDPSFILGNHILRSVQSIYLSFFIITNRFFFISILSSLLATWLGTAGSSSILQVHPYNGTWGFPLVLTSFAASMAVNSLVTGLIVFRILKVFMEVKPTSIERSLGVTGGSKFRSIIFVIIESGMALFAIQLVRVVLVILPINLTVPAIDGLNIVISVNQMFNVIIKIPVLVFFLY